MRQNPARTWFKLHSHPSFHRVYLCNVWTTKRLQIFFWFTKKINTTFLLPSLPEITQHFNFSSEKMCHVPGCAVTLCVMRHLRQTSLVYRSFIGSASFRITSRYLCEYLFHYKIHPKRLDGTDIGSNKTVKPLVSGASSHARRMKTKVGRSASWIPFRRCRKKIPAQFSNRMTHTGMILKSEVIRGINSFFWRCPRFNLYTT